LNAPAGGHGPVSRDGFTLLELATVIVVIGILVLLITGVVQGIKGRAAKANCIVNLRNLFAGAAAYVEHQGRWPQVPPKLIKSKPEEYAREWIAALAPYGITQPSWICPTQDEILGRPDLTKKPRVDYNATPFDAKPRTPYKWARQPWFVEHASVHDGGPLLIYSDGSVLSLKDALKR
jgi:prepilin-type N-terminal cleavage/methylation domain-containing protein